MNKTTLFIGLNDRDFKSQRISTNKAKTIIHSIIGDCTMELVQGVYNNEIENTLKVIVYNFDKNLHQVCNTLKALLNQECILCEVEDVQASFI